MQRELKVVFGDDEAGKAQADGFIGIAVSGENVFCKYFLHKIAKYFCRLLQNVFVGCCTYIL